jgi:hypothetical protein
MNFGPDRLAALLTALDRQLYLAGSPPFGLVVCGGSALAALGLVRRTTRDVDVLGLARQTTDGVVVERLKRLPAALAEAAARWTLTQDVSSVFRVSLKNFLRTHGYEDVAEAL